jgi:hypothetical protein
MATGLTHILVSSQNKSVDRQNAGSVKRRFGRRCQHSHEGVQFVALFVGEWTWRSVGMMSCRVGTGSTAGTWAVLVGGKSRKDGVRITIVENIITIVENIIASCSEETIVHTSTAVVRDTIVGDIIDSCSEEAIVVTNGADVRVRVHILIRPYQVLVR